MSYNPVLLGILLLTAAAVFLASTDAAASSSLPLLPSKFPTEGHGEGAGKSRHGRRTWPCCDRCGGCTKSSPQQCQCQDLVRSCHPSCRNCVRSPLSVSPPMYQCMDRIPNFCQRRCSSEPLLGQ
ncbi:hypothetical protein Cni_G15683 [Canna indica]|uniref:Bowman-Birk serine protease inhibitors family domain-containing protein n=1 Tax=Canna indica TaxID=4628 RepID=A0AAQ3QBV1_9LILI|nr:hypothetical protein Cni_G15683 [Canna indica]